MEMTKTEFTALIDAVQVANVPALKELTELELVLVGGGSGDVVVG